MKICSDVVLDTPVLARDSWRHVFSKTWKASARLGLENTSLDYITENLAVQTGACEVLRVALE